MHVRTRFAPSPTGLVHLGNIRSALYPWAFARHHGGSFILRIEDTDTERSTQASTEHILESLNWLGIDIDEGPYYQSARGELYQKSLQTLLDQGLAYYCYMPEEVLDALRETQKIAKEKPRYDGTWRPEPGKILPPIPDNVQPVVRFKNPLDGDVVWHDAVKGSISIANSELDDFIIARNDGSPTYNFCVVVDDLAMQITHVIRGDDHINNTPKQINLLHALGGSTPVYAHLPTVLNEDGEKMSKRHGAIGVLDYAAQGYLPQAIINYLARLGWSHGDDEVFTPKQLVEWFDLSHLGTSAAQHNPEKLAWLNEMHIKHSDPNALRLTLEPHLAKLQLKIDDDAHAHQAIAVYQQRSKTLIELAENLNIIYQDFTPQPRIMAQNLGQNIDWASIYPALDDLYQHLTQLDVWQKEAIQAIIQQTLKKYGHKMQALGIPLRIIFSGQLQSPSLDQFISILGKHRVLTRLKAGLLAVS